MAGASDKAQFYLERYIPELQEYAQKDIFSGEEISAIIAKRGTFEHILSARGSTPSDYARYITYETNIRRLTRKRCSRLGIKSKRHDGQASIFTLLERATKKFPGDLGLWMQYIEFCKTEKANKKLTRVLTQTLRLMPREYRLWILAAKHYMENLGDMQTARTYFQRGLRFCGDVPEMWLEYARLEVAYLAKIAVRRAVLGVDRQLEPRNDEARETHAHDDIIALPSVTMAELELEVNQAAHTNSPSILQLDGKSAFDGAIPIAVFNAAMEEVPHLLDFAEKFFFMVTSFAESPGVHAVAQHCLTYLQTLAPESAEAIICECRAELFGKPPKSAEFPIALSQVISRLNAAQSSSALAGKATSLLRSIAEIEGLDRRVSEVVETLIHRYAETRIEKQGLQELSSNARKMAE